MKKSKLLMSAAILGIAALTGCSELPQEQIDAANLAIQEARNAGAETYAPNNFSAMEDSMKVAMETIEEQNSKFLFKNFEASTEKLQNVVVIANEVKQQSENEKESLRNEIAATLSSIKILLEENQKLIAEAPRGKEGNAALVAIKGELSVIEQTVAESTNLMSEGQLVVSLEKAKIAQDKANSINIELKEVMAKFKGSTRKAS